MTGLLRLSNLAAVDTYEEDGFLIVKRAPAPRPVRVMLGAPLSTLEADLEAGTF